MLLVAMVRCSLFDPHQHGVRYVGLLRAFKNVTLEVFLGDIYPPGVWYEQNQTWGRGRPFLAAG